MGFNSGFKGLNATVIGFVMIPVNLWTNETVWWVQTLLEYAWMD